MSERASNLLGGICGVAAVVLLIGSFPFTGATPEPGASAADVADYVARFTEHVDLHYLGDLAVRQNAWSIQKAQEFRDAGNSGRIFDIHFRAMQRDPSAQVRALYDWLGEDVTAEFEGNMLRWWKENAENREPNVHPEPSAFGLDLAKVRPLFAEYTARFAPRA